jgi:hypothetical protein
MDEKEVSSMRERSGRVDIHSQLVSFLYELLRDEITVGRMEEIVQNSREPEVQYTNGWLARYAEDVAFRLGCPPTAPGGPGSPTTSTPP